MRKPLLGFLMMVLVSLQTAAQQPVTIRIADTLTQEEKTGRNVVLLRSELDSLVKLNAPATVPNEPVQKQTIAVTSGSFLNAGIVLIVLLLMLLIYVINRQQQKLKSIFRQIKPAAAATPESRGKNKALSPQQKIEDLQDELAKMAKENESLKGVIVEYNGIQKDYESLRHGIQKTFKVKHYPGNEKSQDEQLAMQGVFDTESAVANYAYEKFLKPILAIADRNKNNPARVSDEERQKVLDLLVSLSLLYIEYLYLRVNELSIGGKMVERIKGFSKGNGLDPLLMKQMNKTSGNRALVLRMILDRSDLHKLTYPVFDETNLNN